jgi:phosphatidylinositol alpha-1,6-mannosyltransferase
MKSLLISGTYFPPQVGGISHYMAAVAAALGPERVCCLTGVPCASTVEATHFAPRVYRRPTVFAKTTCVQVAGLGATIAEILVRDRPRVVQLATAGEGYLGLWLNRALRLPYIIYAHGNEVLDAIRSSWDKPRNALRGAARVVANSHFTAGLAEEAGVERGRIEIVHPGCEVEHFRPLPVDLDLRRRLLGDRVADRVVLSVGGLVPRKGHDLVVRALPGVLGRCPDVTYLIVTSDRRNYGQLDALARAVGVRDRVVLAYDVPTSELPAVYALSDVFVMPSRERRDACDAEGFGIVFLEASACGKPVVGGRSGGIGDAVVEGVTGFLVDPHDPADLANALVRLLEDRELAGRLGEQGRQRVTREFTWTRVAGEILAILRSVQVGKPGLN